MSLTKHLYRLDEVRAAFLWAHNVGSVLESLFWLQELEESCYGGEARRLLFISWLMRVGVKRLSWLDAWASVGDTREGRKLLCWQLTRCKERDSSLWWLLWSRVLDGAKSRQEPNTVGTGEPRLQSILQGLQKDMRAYSVFATSTAEAIEKAVSMKQVHADSWAPLQTEIPAHILEVVQGWSEAETIKEQRVFVIPYECLYGMTWRGIGGDTSGELRNLHLERLLASPYWRTQLAQFVEDDKWKSDDAMEEFYDTHFDMAVSDLPDEWSSADQKVSHGPGATGGPGAPLGRWWRNWVGNEYILVDDKSVAAVSRWVASETIGTHASVIDRLLSLYKNLA